MEHLDLEPESSKLQLVACELRSLESRGVRQAGADGRTDSRLMAATVASVVCGLDKPQGLLLRDVLLGA